MTFYTELKALYISTIFQLELISILDGEIKIGQGRGFKDNQPRFEASEIKINKARRTYDQRKWSI